METAEDLQRFVVAVTEEGTRGRLLARGEARALMRQDGVLPEGAPPLGETLDVDLAEYGLSVLRACLSLREKKGDVATWRRGLLRAGTAFEGLVRNGSRESTERGFYRVMSGACYHLAGYSAMAFSIISQGEADANLSPSEMALVHLLLRDLGRLRADAKTWLTDPAHTDRALRSALTRRTAGVGTTLSTIITSTIYRAFSFFEFALATGAGGLHERAVALITRAKDVAATSGAAPLWWICRVAANLIDDLWANSLHMNLPQQGPPGAPKYAEMRRVFLASLYSRSASEVELWPSQIDAATRATDPLDDLVVSLPTSAGKTRIAEICALTCLATEKRVLIVTPLRALSAQTERSFRGTFGPLGYSVSSLYGASGTIGDEYALRERDIVIATPEKLDFALRSDANLIDDVGLIVLDEGHLIGPTERELRYEVLVQRLLRRADAAARRMVCLSAILPDGEQLDNLTTWVRKGISGTPVKSEWRPTRQRFGTLAWGGQSARLTFDLADDGPFVPAFIRQQDAIRPRRTPFPKDNLELTLAAAWRFAEDGKRTLVFCTQRDTVESFADRIVDLTGRGFLSSLLKDPAAVQRAKEIGAEWVGADHPAVLCLDKGIAIHHARLPNQFLREIERLLAQGTLSVTVASPTLAQGLNLNAAVLLVPSLYRAGAPLTAQEFANVAGRAGRAFVDLEGLVIHVMYHPERWRRQAWRDLVLAARARALQSGLISVAAEVLDRLARGGVLSRKDAFEYLANSQQLGRSRRTKREMNRSSGCSRGWTTPSWGLSKT